MASGQGHKTETKTSPQGGARSACGFWGPAARGGGHPPSPRRCRPFDRFAINPTAATHLPLLSSNPEVSEVMGPRDRRSWGILGSHFLLEKKIFQLSSAQLVSGALGLRSSANSAARSFTISSFSSSSYFPQL